MSKEERIKAEKIRLAALFWNLPREKFYTLLGLIDQAAFLRVTLDDMQQAINADGVTDEYKNGENQTGVKISAELQAYNKTAALYEKITRRLMEHVPYESIKRVPGSEENEWLAYKRFKDNEAIEFYLSDEYAAHLEEIKAKALELMAQGN